MSILKSKIDIKEEHVINSFLKKIIFIFFFVFVMDWSVLAAVVTGGASGIGKCVCNDFVQRGASVVIADVNREG